MDRPRAGRLGRRKTQPALASSFDMAEDADSEEHRQHPQTSPAASFPHQTPQTAPASRRGARQMSTPFASSSAHAASSPFSGGALSRRKRIRTFGSDGAADEEDETNKKGSHNLRKRTKIDYSAHDFEDELPEIALPAPRAATRRRRAESEVVADGFTPPATQRRRANSREFSQTDGAPGGRRKTPAKRAPEPQSYFPPSDDVVKDTIEVVGDSSDLHTSDDVSDHESKIESPVAERKFKHHSATPEAIHSQSAPSFNQFDQLDGDGRSPDRNVQAVDDLAGAKSSLEIAHPQPIHINHVSIITTPQLSQDSDGPSTRLVDLKVERLSSRAAHFTSSPRPSSVEDSAAVVPSRPALSTTFAETESPSCTQLSLAYSAPSPEDSALQAAQSSLQEQLQRAGGQMAASEVTRPSQNGQVHNRVEYEDDATYTAKHQSPLPAFRPHEPFRTEGDEACDIQPTAGPIDSMVHPINADDEYDISTKKVSRLSQENIGQSIENDTIEYGDMDIDKISGGGEDEGDAKSYAWSYLTPYVEGEVVLHPEPTMQVSTAGGEGEADEDVDAADGERPEEGDEGNDYEHEAADKADIAMNEEGEQDEDDGDREDGDKNTSHTNQLEEDALQTDGLVEFDSGIATPLPQTPRAGSPISGSAQQTGANTPSASGDKNKPVTVVTAIQRTRKQFRFPKLRDPADYKEFLKDHGDMTTEELWAFLSHVNGTLMAWQDEWQKCGRQVDDAENAKRREVQDADYEKKTANLTQFAKIDSYIEKDFDIRGYRAPIKEKEQGTYHQRWQDRVEAMAYGYEYDPHPSKIGQQDPVAQREGIMAGRQLRSQPQQTAKAAEGDADGLVVTGKRARNPPKLYEGMLQDDVRSATPAIQIVKPILKRRGRPPANAQAEDVYYQQNEQEVTAPAPKIKPGPKKRGPKPKKAAIDTEAEIPMSDPTQGAPKRKRGRQPKVVVAAPEVGMADPDDTEPEDVEEPTPKRARTTRKRGKNARLTSNRPISSETVVDSSDESRPSTSSSNDTISDDGSTYSFRQKKRQRTSRGEAEADEVVLDVIQPPKKKTRINFKASTKPKATKSEAILNEMAAASQSSRAVPGEPSQMLTFKHMGDDKWTIGPEQRTSWDSSTMVTHTHLGSTSAAPSAPQSATSSAAPSQAGDDNQDYRLMTKSQKMSASMKKRWLNGSMQNAVNKRKATLAAKKAANANAAIAASTPPPRPPNGQNPFTNGTQNHQ